MCGHKYRNYLISHYFLLFVLIVITVIISLYLSVVLFVSVPFTLYVKQGVMFLQTSEGQCETVD